METLFIPAKRKLNLNTKKVGVISRKLPKNIALTYSIQYKDVASKINEILSKSHKITKLVQVLGCSKPNFPRETQAILVIGSGKFHAISLALGTKLPVYILEHNHFETLLKKDVDTLKKRQKTAYLKFLNADKVGILISIKPGQQNLKKALIFAKEIKNKKSYLFIGNDINTNEFENFELSSWVNTACPRIDMDNNSVINIDKLNFGY